MGKPLHLGMVGYGFNSIEVKFDLQNRSMLKGRTKLIAGYDPNPVMKQNLMNLEGVKAAGSFEDLLDTPDLEAIMICSPPQFHADQAVAGLEGGLHVFSEIPMALKEEDLERIINAVDLSGKKYELGENYCYLPEVLFAGHLTSTGKIGPVVYAESEYLHDVTYRWRTNFCGDVDTPRVDSWYQLFDPLMYAHSIGPAQIALGGIQNPMPFCEVVSYANDIGGYEGNPICHPAKAFHVGLFKTESGAIAKCANAYIFARDPTRLIIQVTGRTGTYECYEIGRAPGRLFLAEGHVISRRTRRKGKVKMIDKEELNKLIPPLKGAYFGANTRIYDDWLTAIEKDIEPAINARIGANMCHSGIAASKSAKLNGKSVKIKQFLD